jgi:hypothetical protein
MPRPICVKCNREVKVVQTGVSVHAGDNRFWSADLMECGGCGARFTTNYGAKSWKALKPEAVWSSCLVVADMTKM